MAIITISRELAALGDETAYELVKILKYRLVDKQSLEERIKSYGFTGYKLEKYDERKPSLWASLSPDRDDYLHYLKTAVLAEAEEGSAVIIGRGANVIFKDIPGVLSVFLGAPLDIRINRVKSYFHCDERRAQQIIHQSDKDRKGFQHYFFDIEWGHPANYHVTLNTGHLHPALCAGIIKELRDQLVTKEAEAQNLLCLKDLILCQKIKHHILYEEKILIHFLEVKVSHGRITLYGMTYSHALVESAVSAAAHLVPSESIESQIQVVQEYGAIPGTAH